MINSKSHAQSKRGKRFLSRRDYKYGGKIQSHSVHRHFKDTYLERRDLEWSGELVHLNEIDRALKDIGEKLPIEEALGFELGEFKMYGSRHKKQEALREYLEHMHVMKAHGSTKDFFHQKTTYFALPPSLDASSEDLASMKAHAQAREQILKRKLLGSCGISIKNRKFELKKRCNLKQWLPHGEIGSSVGRFDLKGEFCRWTQGQHLNTENRAVVAKFSAHAGMDIGGVGIQSVQLHEGRNREQYTAPVTFKIFFRNMGEDTWVGLANDINSASLYNGPGNYRKESTYKVNLTNVAEIKIVSRSIRVFGEKYDFAQPRRHRYSPFFNVYVYGTKRKTDKISDTISNSITAGSIKNPQEHSETTIQLVDKVHARSKALKKGSIYYCSRWRARKGAEKEKKDLLISQAKCDYMRKEYDLTLLNSTNGA